MYCGKPSPLSSRSFNLAWAISRPTIMVPLNDRRVETGYCDSSFKISGIGRLRSILTTWPSVLWRKCSGIYFPGFCSSFSNQMPLRLILPLILRSAEQDTPHADRAGGSVAWQANDPNIVGKVFAAKLRAQT